MTVMEALALVTLVVTILSGLTMPFLIQRLGRQDVDRQTLRQEIHERLDHLDTCMDETKRLVLGKMVHRTDLETYKNELQITMTRMREAITADHKALHDRLMRLESRYFGGDPHLLIWITFACPIAHFIVC
jgi:hypothetical protein